MTAPAPINIWTVLMILLPVVGVIPSFLPNIEGAAFLTSVLSGACLGVFCYLDQRRVYGDVTASRTLLGALLPPLYLFQRGAALGLASLAVIGMTISFNLVFPKGELTSRISQIECATLSDALIGVQVPDSRGDRFRIVRVESVRLETREAVGLSCISEYVLESGEKGAVRTIVVETPDGSILTRLDPL
jgi:hypothetical protein